jgi:hypothetical protein
MAERVQRLGAQSHEDQRQFGRRQTVWHAWVLVNGRPAQACIVRNISPTGALLEFPDGAPVAEKFQLVIDYITFSSWCDVRHRAKWSAGVCFPIHEVSEPQIKCAATNAVVADVRKALIAQ